MNRFRQNSAGIVWALAALILLMRISGAHAHWLPDAPVESAVHEWLHHAHGDHHADHPHAGPQVPDVAADHAHAHGAIDLEVPGLSSASDRLSRLMLDIAIVLVVLIGMAWARSSPRRSPTSIPHPPDLIVSRGPPATGPPTKPIA